MNNYAKYPYGNARGFKEKKRKDIRKVLLELDELTIGCAFTPAYYIICNVREELEKARDLMSIKKWGR